MHQLHTTTPTILDCGDSFFSTICQLIATKFDIQFLRLYIVQTFFQCNDGKVKRCIGLFRKIPNK